MRFMIMDGGRRNEADQKPGSEEPSAALETAVKTPGQELSARDIMNVALVPQLRVFASRELDAWNADERDLED